MGIGKPSSKPSIAHRCPSKWSELLFNCNFVIYVLLLFNLSNRTLWASELSDDHQYPSSTSVLPIEMYQRNDIDGILDDDTADDDEQQPDVMKSSKYFDANDVRKLQQIIMQGLGLKSIPDTSKMNISHAEYTEKYSQYLAAVRRRERLEVSGNLLELGAPKKLFQFTQRNHTSDFHHRRKRSTTYNNNDMVYIRFHLPTDDLPSDVDESTLRVMIKSHTNYNTESNPNKHRSVILRAYQLTEFYSRILLDTQTVQLNLNHPTSNWIEFDVSQAIEKWISGDINLGFEIYCDGCDANGMHIVHDISTYTELPEFSPILNVVGKMIHREKRSRQHRHFMQNSNRKPRKTDCSKDNQKCCRHTMEVVFKEIKGFEFIIQPKNFDAGYCRGKCPPRYNPANHHAILQSLIWKQDKNKAPRPCCAPSKLMELEVLHVDESDCSQLKVSTWEGMRVMECACS